MAETKPPTAGQRVTIRTVAEDAGVSVAAVSKVLRNAYGVSDALRLKVEQSIERLAYRPSAAARGMRGQTYTLGVLLVDIANPFLPAVYEGIAQVAEGAGYKIMVGIGASKTQVETSLIEQMIDNRMDGIVLVAAQLSGRTLLRYASQIPIVVIGHHEPALQGFDTVNSADRDGGRQATEALIARGYRDIAMASLGPDMHHEHDVGWQRELGYADAMAAAGLPPRILRFSNRDPRRTERMAAMLAAPDRPRAMFVWSDLDAVQMLNMARQMGLRVPEDLALIGYDNSSVAALPLIDLASMDQDGARLGKIAAEALLTRIGGRQVTEHRMIPPTLVRRASY